MNEKKHEIGKTVYLKSGGPAMTINQINDFICYCKWFIDFELKEGKFHEESLTDVKPKNN